MLGVDAVVAQYPGSPKLIAGQSFVPPSASNSTTPTLQVSMDLLKDDPQVLAPPGQPAAATTSFKIQRGLMESYVEGQVLSQFAAGQAGANGSVQVFGSAISIMNAAQAAGIGRTVISASRLNLLAGLNISAEAMARITASVEAGNYVEVPNQAVTIGGVPQIGWLEFQPDGTTQGVLENGDHGALFQYTAKSLHPGCTARK